MLCYYVWGKCNFLKLMKIFINNFVSFSKFPIQDIGEGFSFALTNEKNVIQSNNSLKYGLLKTY